MLGGAAVAIGCSSAKQGNWDFLSDSQARTLAAICDQIVPADGFPSASQAGVLYYIDKQLARHYRRNRDEYRHGLEQASHRSRSRFGRDLADLTSEHQLEIVRAIEQEDHAFFELGSPRHGGNRDAVSWRMLGLAEPPVRGRAQYDLRKPAS